MAGKETDDLASDDKENLIRRLEELEKDFKEMAAAIDPILKNWLREYAGPVVDTMLRSPEDTMKYLSDANPRLRAAAVRLAYQHWEITDTLATVYENMSISDSSIDVREAAIGALGTTYARTADARIGQILAAIVHHDGLGESMRLTAFCSLLRVHGNMTYAGTSPLVPTSLEHIDWTLVDQYYRQR